MDGYYRAAEILKRNPQITWNASQVGSLFWMGLAKGKKFPRHTIIREEDVLKIFEFKNS